MSLRDRLAAKAGRPRRVTVSIPVSDPGEGLRKQAEDAANALALADAGLVQDLAEGVLDALRTRAESLAAQIAEHYIDIDLRAVSPAAWEDILNDHRLDDDDLAGTALPAMLAACCVDDDLQDAAWWAEHLGQPGWTFGEREALRSALLRLNGYHPRPSLGKG